MVTRGKVVFVVALVVLLAGAVIVEAASVATLDPIQGVIQHQTDADGADAWQTVTQRQTVGEGDWIRTDGQGVATLTFFDGAESEIFPNSLIQVSRLVVEEGGTFEVSFAMMAGDTVNRLARAVDAGSRYEITTPAAVIVVRGTVLWVSVSPTGDTLVTVQEGSAQVTGILADGTPGDSVTVEAGQAVDSSIGGELGVLSDAGPFLKHPPQAPLAPDTCGNTICEPGEDEICATDCQQFPGCGDNVCVYADGESPITCAPDCVFGGFEEAERLPHLEFLWGNMTCPTSPPGNTFSGPFEIGWGIGCFESAAHASAYPHPADYQLVIDGQVWTGAISQSGPYVHWPFCPWGWTYRVAPVELPPGEHVLVLTQVLTDVWWEGGTLGETNTLTCPLTIE